MTSPVSRRPATLRLALGGAFVALATLTAQAEETRPIPQSPDILLGPLFNDVQSAKLFSDQKTFADAIPNGDPLMILADDVCRKIRPALICGTLSSLTLPCLRKTTSTFRQKGKPCASISMDSGQC